MPRKGHVTKRDVLADPVYNSKLVTKLINHLMIDGKRAKASSILYDAFTIVKDKTGKEPLDVFEEAMNNVMPVLEVKARRIGGSTYQVPIEVKADRGFALASSWLIESAKKRGGKSFIDKLTNELLDAANGQGASCKKREDTHRMAEANKAFAHYRY